jgi:hypothetical protein
VKLSISEAARRAGVDRATIHRKIREGVLSKEIGEGDRPFIDLSELARLYPLAVAPAQGARSDVPQLRTEERAGDSNGLAVEIAVLRERVSALERERDQLAEDKRAGAEREARLLTLAEVSQRLLADQRPAGPERRPGFFGRLLVRDRDR